MTRTGRSKPARGGGWMRAGKGRVTIAAGFVMIAAIATPAWAAQERYFSFNIPAGSLDVALRRYARMTGLQLLYRGDTVRGLRTRGVTGNLTAPDALSRLLSGTTLIVSRPTPKTVVIQIGSNSVSQATPSASRVTALISAW
ncbi:STN domain-containing protein [Sphingomonas sp.]|uniref:STN domain-containing protein n=1 Tax=Sphingomonas sp. TaxID=28214 RepID=UPI003441855B